MPVGGRHARRSRRAAHELATSPTVGPAACAWLERRSALQSGWLGRNGVQRGRRGGLRCRCPSVSAAPPILCLRPVVSCLHPSRLLCLASGTRPDASPPPYARSFWPMPASENTPLLPQLDRVLPPFLPQPWRPRPAQVGRSCWPCAPARTRPPAPIAKPAAIATRRRRGGRTMSSCGSQRAPKCSRPCQRISAATSACWRRVEEGACPCLPPWFPLDPVSQRAW